MNLRNANLGVAYLVLHQPPCGQYYQLNFLGLEMIQTKQFIAMIDFGLKATCEYYYIQRREKLE
jgi:hypothetical protein